nr:MAG TPA: hypothetical protein [Caudoviricetes sp.]
MVLVLIPYALYRFRMFVVQFINYGLKSNVFVNDI